jgi:hypothetical protein
MLPVGSGIWPPSSLTTPRRSHLLYARSRSFSYMNFTYVGNRRQAWSVYIRRSRPGLGVLRVLLAALSVFEPVLVLLAAGHGGAFEGIPQITTTPLAVLGRLEAFAPVRRQPRAAIMRTYS